MKRALLLACGSYEDETFVPLRYPLSDVGSVEALLKDQWLCGFDEIEVLKDPRKAQAHRSIERLTSQSSRDDFILLYFSGHGKLSRNGSVSMVFNDTESEFLHSTGILDDDLRCMFNQSRAGQKMIVLDCCHSGAAGEEGFKRASEDAIEALAQQVEGTFILSASTKFQPAFEQAELEGSVLTRCLVEGVRTGAAAAKGSAVITLSQLGDYLVREVPRHSSQQPKFWDHGGVGAAPFARAQKRLDREWADETVKRLGGLLAEDVIDDETFDELRTVLRAELAGCDDPRLQMIDDLVERRTAPIVFVRRWSALEKFKVDAVPERVAPSPQEPHEGSSSEPIVEEAPSISVSALGETDPTEDGLDQDVLGAVPAPTQKQHLMLTVALWAFYTAGAWIGWEGFYSNYEYSSDEKALGSALIFLVIAGLMTFVFGGIGAFRRRRLQAGDQQTGYSGKRSKFSTPLIAIALAVASLPFFAFACSIMAEAFDVYSLGSLSLYMAGFSGLAYFLFERAMTRGRT